MFVVRAVTAGPSTGRDDTWEKHVELLREQKLED